MLFCVQFSTIASAGNSSENFIDSDLREWNNLFPDTTQVFYRTRVANGVTYGAYGFTSIGEPIQDTGLKLKCSEVYDLTPLISGNSYSFNFHLLSLEDANFITHGITEENYYGGLLNGNGSYIIGLASFNSNIEAFDMVDGAYIEIDKDNYLDYYGKDNTISFVLPNIVNPCLVIAYYETSNRNYQQNIYLNNISLVDNEQAKEDGFFAKLFDWFQEKFDAIGESFTNLGNDIKQGLIDLKNDLINGIKSLFVPDEEFMEEYSNKWDELIHTRLGAVAQVSGVLYDFFESILAYSGGEQNTISVPAVTLPLPDNASFTFGGFDVEIVNEKFVFLQDAVKLLVGILSTFAFIYGLRKRYDEVMGVDR